MKTENLWILIVLVAVPLLIVALGGGGECIEYSKAEWCE